ncbi:hypothetical protein WMF18_34340 [Sorangium sp. So ce315]|uniref:hypothetical protein n=1 Tax=Sorangium sp. So ce315 TaxID=3133299 RepID=UPI003F619D0E
MTLPRIARLLAQVHPIQALARPIALGQRALGRGPTAALAPRLRSGVLAAHHSVDRGLE